MRERSREVMTGGFGGGQGWPAGGGAESFVILRPMPITQSGSGRFRGRALGSELLLHLFSAWQFFVIVPDYLFQDLKAELSLSRFDLDDFSSSIVLLGVGGEVADFSESMKRLPHVGRQFGLKVVNLVNEFLLLRSSFLRQKSFQTTT